MFKLFRNKNVQELKPDPSADKAAFLIAKAFVRMQTAWANWLSAKEKTWTLQQKKIALAIFCIGMSVLSGSFLYNGIVNKQNISPSWLKTPSVTLPEDTRLPDSLNLDYLRELYKRKQAERLQNDSTHN